MYAWANTPNFLHAVLDKSACVPFFKERHMKFAEPIGLNRKFGDMGHPSHFLGLLLRHRLRRDEQLSTKGTGKPVPFVGLSLPRHLRVSEGFMGCPNWPTEKPDLNSQALRYIDTLLHSRASRHHWE